MRLFQTLSFVLFMSVGGLFPLPAGAEEPCLLSVGVVPQFEQRRLVSIWQPLLTELERRVGCALDFSGSENISSFEKRFQQGDFDLAYMNPYHALIANRAQGYEPVMRSGSRGLQGVLVVAKSSGIENIQQLNDQVLAFPSPNALGASLLMRAELIGVQGLSFETRYVRTHPSVYLHVVKGLAAAGGGVQRTFDEQPQQIRDRLNVIYRTRKVPSHPLVLHPRVVEPLRSNLLQALSALASSQPELFESIPMRDPVPTAMSEYQVISTLNLQDFAN